MERKTIVLFLTLVCKVVCALDTVDSFNRDETSSGSSLSKSYFFLWLGVIQTVILFFFWQRGDPIPKRDLSVFRYTNNREKSISTQQRNIDTEKEIQQTFEQLSDKFAALSTKISMMKQRRSKTMGFVSGSLKNKLHYCLDEITTLLSELDGIPEEGSLKYEEMNKPFLFYSEKEIFDVKKRTPVHSGKKRTKKETVSVQELPSGNQDEDGRQTKKQRSLSRKQTEIITALLEPKDITLPSRQKGGVYGKDVLDDSRMDDERIHYRDKSDSWGEDEDDELIFGESSIKKDTDRLKRDEDLTYKDITNKEIPESKELKNPILEINSEEYEDTFDIEPVPKSDKNNENKEKVIPNNNINNKYHKDKTFDPEYFHFKPGVNENQIIQKKVDNYKFPMAVKSLEDLGSSNVHPTSALVNNNRISRKKPLPKIPSNRNVKLEKFSIPISQNSNNKIDKIELNSENVEKLIKSNDGKTENNNNNINSNNNNTNTNNNINNNNNNKNKVPSNAESDEEKESIDQTKINNNKKKKRPTSTIIKEVFQKVRKEETNSDADEQHSIRSPRYFTTLTDIKSTLTQMIKSPKPLENNVAPHDNRPSRSKSEKFKPGVTKRGKNHSTVKPKTPSHSENIVTSSEGENNFDILKRQQQQQQQLQLKEERLIEQNEVSDSFDKSCDIREKSDSFEEEEPLLIYGYGVADSLNESGLRRSKKTDITDPTGKRRVYQMEDTNYCQHPFNNNKNMALFCVFDGHAGPHCSQELITVFPEVLKKHYKKNNNNFPNTNLEHFWRLVYREVDDSLMNNKHNFEYEGSTATTVLLWQSPDGKRYLQSANIGDSSSFLYRNKEAIPLTEIHKPTTPSEKIRLEREGIKLGAQTRLNGIAVSRAFGDFFPKEVKCGIISVPYLSNLYEIGPQDTKLIVASDGLWDVITSQRAFELTKDISDPEMAANELVNCALKNPKCTDNITVVVVNLQAPKS